MFHLYYTKIRKAVAELQVEMLQNEPPLYSLKFLTRLLNTMSVEGYDFMKDGVSSRVRDWEKKGKLEVYRKPAKGISKSMSFLNEKNVKKLCELTYKKGKIEYTEKDLKEKIERLRKEILNGNTDYLSVL
ncbi:MAG: hypothetical protein KAW40_01085 [Candidatus Aenigmarchaeota archaeon]|nr:hypothetical protein [Candidatus Aenigmarchaeota archaeon]